MKATLKLATLATVLVLGATAPIQAQGLTFGLKAGVGATVSDVGDQRARANVALAGILDYKLSENASVFAELRYRDHRAEYYEATRVGNGYSEDGVLLTNGIQLLNTGSGATLRYGSVDMRRDTVEAVSLAFGYRAPFFLDGLTWHAGISADWVKSLQEVTGQITVNPGSVVLAPTDRNVEGLAATPSEKGIKPGAFVGLQMPISSNFFVEVNAVYFSFKQINYRPWSYTGLGVATTETKNESKIVLEANIGFRF